MTTAEQAPMALIDGQIIPRRLLLIGSLGALFGASGCDGDIVSKRLPSNRAGGEPVPLPEVSILPKHPGLIDSGNKQLALLGRYEQRLGRGFRELMLFRTLPHRNEDAHAEAESLTPILEDYAQAGIKPHLIFEPVNQDLKTLNFGAYRTLFASLRSAGITASQLGTITPLPEANTPLWGVWGSSEFGGTDPALFTRNIQQFSEALRASFPNASLGVLLDGQTYPNGDTQWNYGRHVSLEPYLRDLRGIASRFVLQGFPWMGPARLGETPAQQFDPNVFLPTKLAIEAARILDIREVTFNTGTFASRYDWSPASRVAVGAPERQQLLAGILAQAETLRAAGLKPTIHLFAQDKRRIEADWSYADEASWRVLQDFVERCTERQVDISLFDSTEQAVA
jgi:hypothetical protein